MQIIFGTRRDIHGVFLPTTVTMTSNSGLGCSVRAVVARNRNLSIVPGFGIMGGLTVVLGQNLLQNYSTLL